MIVTSAFHSNNLRHNTSVVAFSFSNGTEQRNQLNNQCMTHFGGEEDDFKNIVKIPEFFIPSEN